MRVDFSATVDASMRKAVEHLFFFHPRQGDLIEAIRATIETSGLPEILISEDRIAIGVPSGIFQCLFAIHADSGTPVGVALYGRPDPKTLWIAHFAALPGEEFVSAGETAAELLFGKLSEIARTIRGVERIQLPYQESRYLRLRPAARTLA